MRNNKAGCRERVISVAGRAGWNQGCLTRMGAEITRKGSGSNWDSPFALTPTGNNSG